MRQQLEGLLFGSLTGQEAQEVLAHLETECASCREVLAPLVTAFVTATPEEASPDEPGDLPGFDEAYGRAVALALKRKRGMDSARARMKEHLPRLREARHFNDLAAFPPLKLDPWVYCEALLECSREQRHRRPERMMFFAFWAHMQSTFLRPERYGSGAVADLQARCWAELANAYRVADLLPAAAGAMATAHKKRKEGSGDLLLEARILDLAASLDRAYRRPVEAARKLERAYEIFRQLGEKQQAGRTLVNKSLCLMHQQRSDEAFEVLKTGLPLIDPAADPKLTLAAHHNFVRLLMEKGEHRRARRELFRIRSLYQEDGDPINLLKLRWLEAQIAAGLGELDRAEVGLKAVRAEFAEAALEYKAALAGLELAAVWVRQGKTGQVLPLIEEILAVFEALDITREAIAALLLLRTVCEQGILSLEVVQQVTDFLRRLEHDPTARFEI